MQRNAIGHDGSRTSCKRTRLEGGIGWKGVTTANEQQKRDGKSGQFEKLKTHIYGYSRLLTIEMVMGSTDACWALSKVSDVHSSRDDDVVDDDVALETVSASVQE